MSTKKTEDVVFDQAMDLLTELLGRLHSTAWETTQHKAAVLSCCAKYLTLAASIEGDNAMQDARRLLAEWGQYPRFTKR